MIEFLIFNGDINSLKNTNKSNSKIINELEIKYKASIIIVYLDSKI